MVDRAFASIVSPRSPAKPRSTGLTMLIDWGVPPRALDDLLDEQSDFIDLAKIAVGISAILPEERVAARIDSYRRAGVEPFPGGMFAELAHRQGQITEYFDECARIGYRLVEISDNVVHFTSAVRKDLIRRAVDGHGFRVLGEVGSKKTATSAATLLRDITDALDAGAWKVLVEAAELIGSDGLDTELIPALLAEVDADALMFELPGRWLDGYRADQAQQLARAIIEVVGPDANIANVVPEDVLPMETLRTGLGVSMSFPARPPDTGA